MASGPTITAKFLADTKDLTTGVDQATSGAGGKIKDFAKGAAVALGGAFAIGAVVDFAKGSIEAASNLEESMSKVGVVFGGSAKAVQDWSADSAEAMGISQRAISYYLAKHRLDEPGE